jgi:hypothetical protein
VLDNTWLVRLYLPKWKSEDFLWKDRLLRAMQKKSVSRGLKAFCLFSIVCVNGIIVTEAFSQTNPFPFDAQLRYNGSGAGIDGNTSVGASQLGAGYKCL